jgi:hypothetical protein
MQDAKGRVLAQILPKQCATFLEGNFDEIDRKEEDPHLFIIWAILILLATGSRPIY